MLVPIFVDLPDSDFSDEALVHSSEPLEKVEVGGDDIADAFTSQLRELLVGLV